MKILFVIPVFQPEVSVFTQLLKQVEAYSVFIRDNTEDIQKSVNFLVKRDKIKLPSSVILSAEGINIGYAAAVNLGINFGYEHGYDWIVICNDDIKISGSFIPGVVKELQKTPIGIAGSFPGFLEKNRWSTEVALGHNTRLNPEYFSGSFWAIHRSFVESVGYLYEPYFLYYEEVEYCVRAKKNHVSFTVLKTKGIEHNDTRSLGKGSLQHRYYLARNHLLFVERNAPPSVKLHELFRLPKTIFEAHKNHDTGSLLGIRDYLLRKFGPFTK